LVPVNSWRCGQRTANLLSTSQMSPIHNDLDNLLPLMKRKGVRISKEAFHEIVNKVFHDIESEYYDSLHKDMDNSLQQQFDLLAYDIISRLQDNSSKKFVLLDIGCGTGMSTDKLLKSPLGKYISKVYLLDTSKGMLEQCARKAKEWNIAYELINGDIYSIEEVKADIILICSVLHHIPNLSLFLQKITDTQNPKGFFIHLQDSNGDYLNSSAYLEREADLKNYKRKKRSSFFLLAKVFTKISSKMRKVIGLQTKNYIHEVNEKLLKLKIIQTPLKSTEIWSITDIHVEGLPYSDGKGISISFIEKTLEKYTLVKVRSYAFFGDMKSELPDVYQQKEEQWILEEKKDGRLVSAVWQLKD
jgi:ubiquinone/menaquinone biosynthesis C-methylase UbiE